MPSPAFVVRCPVCETTYPYARLIGPTPPPAGQSRVMGPAVPVPGQLLTVHCLVCHTTFDVVVELVTAPAVQIPWWQFWRTAVPVESLVLRSIVRHAGE
jgi:hypothetical protein